MNCSILTIETTPTQTARKYYSGKSKKWWFAVPYPSSFHWYCFHFIRLIHINELFLFASFRWEGIRNPSWEPDLALKGVGREVVEKRPYLALFVGSLHTVTVASNQLRRRLFADCLAAGNLSRSRRCFAVSTEHSDSAALHPAARQGVLLYRQATFCLAPPGDSLTRKSLFDSLLAGCIPVIFCSATASQYTWHLPQWDNLTVSVVVYISRQEVVEGLNFLHVLGNLSDDYIRSMQRRIRLLAPSLQYSIVPQGYGPEFSPTWPSKGKNIGRKGPYRGDVFRPPVRDAVDVIVDKILDPRTIEPINGFSPQQLEDIRINQRDINMVTPSFTGYKDRISAAKAEKRIT